MKKFILRKEKQRIVPFIGTPEQFEAYLMNSSDKILADLVRIEKEKRSFEILPLFGNLKIS